MNFFQNEKDVEHKTLIENQVKKFSEDIQKDDKKLKKIDSNLLKIKKEYRTQLEIRIGKIIIYLYNKN
jgi:hypothetical protein